MSYIGANAQGLISSIDGGTISNATLDSTNTFNFANDSISGDKIDGGTISGSALASDVTMSANQACVKTALNASGNAPIYACRAWVNFQGTGTVAIRDSGNVSSITDNGTGNYTVNLATAMPDANYAISVEAQLEVTADRSYNNFSSLATGSFNVVHYEQNAQRDAGQAHVAIFR